MALSCTENGSITHCQSSCGPVYMQWMQFQNCGVVALGHDQCARHWKVIPEFSVPVCLLTSAIHLLMILSKSLHLSVLLFMLQTLWCKGTLLVHLHSA